MSTRVRFGCIAAACCVSVPAAHADVVFGTINRSIFAEAQGAAYVSDTRSNASTGLWSDSLSFSQNGAPGGGMGFGSGAASQTSTISAAAINFTGFVSRSGFRQGNFGSGRSMLIADFSIDEPTQIDLITSRSGAAQLAFFADVDGTSVPLGTSSRLLAPGMHTVSINVLAIQSDSIADLTGNFSLTFVPAPGSACVLGCAALVVRRRRL